VLLLVLVVELPVLRDFFATSDVNCGQGLACVAVASSIVVAGEAVKAFALARDRRRARLVAEPA
jgi:Ca2+-transporting ATPase